MKWFLIPFSRGPHSVRTLHRDWSILVAPHGMAHGSIELDKAVVHKRRLYTWKSPDGQTEVRWIIFFAAKDRETLQSAKIR